MASTSAPAPASASGATDPSHSDVVFKILSAKSHFEVLGGVLHRSTDDEVKKKYRLLALKTHPDKNKHERAEEAFKRVHNAFVSLETQERRDAYHRSGGRGLRVPGEDDDDIGFSGFQGGFGGARYADPFDFFNIFMGMGSRRGGGGLDEMMMMMMLQEMLRGGGGGGPFHGHGMYHDDDEDVYYEDDDEYYGDDGDYDEFLESEEEEADDPELEGVFYDALRHVYICEGCGIELRDQHSLQRHLLTEVHQSRFGEEYVSQQNSDEEYDEPESDGLVYNTRDEVFVCRPCNVSLKRRAEMETHVNGKRHKSQVAKEDFYCECCDVRTTTKEEKQKHLTGKRHLRQVRTAGTAQSATTAKAAPARYGNIVEFFCEYCNMSMPKEEKQKHLSTNRHLRQVRTNGAT